MDIESQGDIKYRQPPFYLKDIFTYAAFIFTVLLAITLSKIQMSLTQYLVFGFIFIISSTISFLIAGMIIILPRYSKYIVNTLVTDSYPSDLDENEQPHAAFIINRSHDLTDLEYVGFDNLIKGFTRLEYPFKMYHCYDENDFKNVLKNKNTKYLWIFGHGWRGGVGWKEKQSVFEWIKCKGKESRFAYSEIIHDDEDYPKKDFIAQFHCNPKLPIKSFIARHIRRCESSGAISNTPLICILLRRPFDESNYFITKGYLNAPSTWYFTRQMVKEISRREKSREFLRK